MARTDRVRAVNSELLTREVRLKDGRLATIRPLRRDDTRAAWECNRLVVAAGVGVARRIDELDKPFEDVEREFERQAALLESGGGCQLVAVVEGAIAGSAIVRRHTRSRVRHVGHIGIGVAPTFQGLGLGRCLVEGLIAWACAMPARSVTRLDLVVFADNQRAINLYHALGFEVEGRRRRAVRYEDGSEIDELIMALLLDEAP